MFETLALAELDRIEKILTGGKTTGDAVDDVVLLGSSKRRITIGDKHYLKAGVSAPLTDFPKYSGINQSTDYTKDTVWDVMSNTTLGTPQQSQWNPKEIMQDSEGTYWRLYAYHASTNLGPAWFLEYSTDLKTWTKTALGGGISWASPYNNDRVLDWLVVNEAILLLDTRGNLICNRTPKDPTGWRRLDYVATSSHGAVISTDTRMAWFRGSDLVCFMTDYATSFWSYKAKDLLDGVGIRAGSGTYGTGNKTTTNDRVVQLLACSDGMTGYRLCYNDPAFYRTTDGGMSWSADLGGPPSGELTGEWFVLGTAIGLLYGGKFYYRTAEMSAWASYTTIQYSGILIGVYPLNDRWLVRYWRITPSSGSSYIECDYLPADKIGTPYRPWAVNPPSPWGGTVFGLTLRFAVYDQRGDVVRMEVIGRSPSRDETYNIAPPKNCIHLPKTTEYQYLRVS